MTVGMRSQIPNSLTVLRVVLAAGFFAALNMFRFPDEHVLWANIAVGLFIAAALTDAFDGHLARKWKVESVFGRLMDPFCDKVLIIGAFMYLTGPRFAIPGAIERGELHTMATGVYPWMVVLILARELLVTGIRGVVESLGHSGASNWSGKAKMILQCVAVPVVVFLVANFNPLEHAWAWWTCNGLVYVTVAITVWSGVPYIFSLQRVLAIERIKRAADDGNSIAR